MFATIAVILNAAKNLAISQKQEILRYELAETYSDEAATAFVQR